MGPPKLTPLRKTYMVVLWIAYGAFTHCRLFFLHWGLNQDTRQGARHSRNAPKNRGSAQQILESRFPTSLQKKHIKCATNIPPIFGFYKRNRLGFEPATFRFYSEVTPNWSVMILCHPSPPTGSFSYRLCIIALRRFFYLGS